MPFHLTITPRSGRIGAGKSIAKLAWPPSVGSAMQNAHNSHVNLALNYTRAADRLDAAGKRYLQSLLETRCGTTHYHLSSTSRIRIFYSTSSRVVRARFLHRTEYRLYCRDQDASAWLQRNITHGAFCAHQSAERAAWLAGNRGLVSIIANPTFFYPGHSEVYAGCPHCATDMLMQRTGLRCELLIWKDLGQETSPAHPWWLSHVSAKVKIRREFGSARMLYQSADAASGMTHRDKA